MKKTIAIVGAGPGLGNHIARKFGTEGFKVILMARNATKLAHYVTELTSEGIDAEYQTIDVSSDDSIKSSFNEAKNKYGRIDVMVYNVAMMQANRPLELTASELLTHYQTDVAGALTAAQQVIPMQKEAHAGTLLFTGGGFASFPAATNTTMSLDKAALHNLTMILAQALKSDGIFSGIVTITGQIGQDEHFSPANIAEKYWQLYTQRDSNEVIYE